MNWRESAGNSIADGMGWPVPPWKLGVIAAAMMGRGRI